MDKTGKLIFLHGLLVLYSLGGVAGKKAAACVWGSHAFVGLCGIMLVLFVLYAVGWQRVLQHMPLTVAYAHRGITVFWGMVFGYVFFDEPITGGKIAGILLVICGLVLFALENRVKDV